MYAEPVVIFQKSRKCFRGCRVIVFFKMEHKIWGQKYGQLISASLVLADTCRYHAQLSMVASYIDMISVIFIQGKLLKLHAPMSIHPTSISSPLNRNTDCPQSLLHRVPGKENHFNFDSCLISGQFTFFPFLFLLP